MRRRLWIFLWSAALMYALGILCGQRPHVLLAATMVGLAAREWALSRRSLAEVELDISAPDLIEQGTVAQLSVRARSPAQIHALEVWMSTVPAEHSPWSGVLFEALPADREQARTLSLGKLSRGSYPYGTVVLETEGEMGLIRRRQERLVEGGLDVYPRPLAPLRVVAPPLEPLEVTTGLLPGPVGPLGTSLLRPFGSGDDLRRIHWRATARLGEIVVLSTRLGKSPRVLLLVDTAPSAAFERVLRVASWAIERRWEGRSVTLALASDRVEEVHLGERDALALGRRRLAAARPGTGQDLAAFLAHVPRCLPECEIAIIAAAAPHLPSLEGFPLGLVLAGEGPADQAAAAVSPAALATAGIG